MIQKTFILLILWAGVCAPFSSAQTNPMVSDSSAFNTFLSMFRTVYLNDSLYDISDLYKMDEYNTPLKNAPLYERYMISSSPFFNSRPVAKFKKDLFWYVIALNEYHVANIQLLYVEIISFSDSAEIKDMICLKVLDEHGGLYDELDERKLNQGHIYLNTKGIIYHWYEQVSKENEFQISKSQYFFDNTGRFKNPVPFE